MAEESEDGQEKTHEPTERKLEQARERGQVPHSQEVSNVLVYVAAALLVFGFGEAILTEVSNLFITVMSKSGTIAAPSGGQGIGEAVHAFLAELGFALLPLAATFMAAALLPSIVQNTIVLAPERIKPKANKISPVQGLKKIFGAKNLVEFAKGMVTIAVITVTVWLVLDSYFGDASALVRSPFEAATEQMADGLAYLLIAMIFVAVVIAVIDIAFQRFEHRRQLRMTPKELQDEQKQTEGDPEVKKRLQKLRQEKAQSRMMQDVPDADVVLSNPTHYAVALKYQRGRDVAPRCVAKGVDELAQRIRKVGADNGVPVLERPDLARALYSSVDLGEAIPESFYRAVAAVLRYVGSLETRERGGAA